MSKVNRNNIRCLLYLFVYRLNKDGAKRHLRKIPHVTTAFNIFGLFTKKAPQKTEKMKYPSIIEQADELFNNEKYMEAYDLLNTLKFYTDIEVLWRISRSLYKMACDNTTTKDVQKELLDEAFTIIDIALQHEEKTNPNVHKWMAIILDARCDLEGTLAKVRNAQLVKEHLMKALEASPDDFTLLYMLGHWCFNMSSLTWFQRQIATFLFGGNIPVSSYEEAYKYFFKAEQLQPRLYIPNTFMLGKVCYYLKQYFRARYYLNEAASLTARNDYEKKCAIEAKILAAELEFFELSREAILRTFF